MYLDAVSKHRLRKKCEAHKCPVASAERVVREVLSKFHGRDLDESVRVGDREFTSVGYARHLAGRMNLPSSVEQVVWDFFVD